METERLHIHQNILEQFKLLQVDIEYSRFLSEKSECTLVIESKQCFLQWSELLKKTLFSIEQSSSSLDKAVQQGKNHEDLLSRLDAAIDDLVHLQIEITASCAHETSLMEGRYLLDYAVGSCLDQLSFSINEYRYQLNQLIFNCNKEDSIEEPLPLSLTFKKEVETEAFLRWLSGYETNLSRLPN